MRTNTNLIVTLGLIATLALPGLASARGYGGSDRGQRGGHRGGNDAPTSSRHDGPSNRQAGPSRFVAQSELVNALEKVTWLRPDQALALAKIEAGYEAREAALLVELAEAKADLAKTNRRSRRGRRGWGYSRQKANALAAINAIEAKLAQNAERAQWAALQELNGRQERGAKWVVVSVLKAPVSSGTVAVYRGGARR